VRAAGLNPSNSGEFNMGFEVELIDVGVITYDVSSFDEFFERSPGTVSLGIFDIIVGDGTYGYTASLGWGCAYNPISLGNVDYIAMTKEEAGRLQFCLLTQIFQMKI
jgi:hypothetical protein